MIYIVYEYLLSSIKVYPKSGINKCYFGVYVHYKFISKL